MKKEVKSEEGLGIAGFILGVSSFLFLLSNFFVGIITSIIGFIFCYIQQKRHPINLGRIGMILNIIGFVLGIISTFFFFKYLGPLINQQVGYAG